MIKQRFSISGRLRLDICQLERNPFLAKALEDAARAVEGVTHVRASPISGSLLILYEPGPSAAGTHDKISSVVESTVRNTSSEPTLASPLTRSERPLTKAIDIASAEVNRRWVAPATLTALAFSTSTLENLLTTTLLDVAGGKNSQMLESFGLSKPRSQILALAALTGAVTGPGRWLGYARQHAWRTRSQEVEHSLRTALFVHVENQDLRFFENHGTGEMLNLLTGDVSNVGAIVSELDGVVESTLTLIAASSSILRQSPRLAGAAALTIPLMLVPMRVLKPRRQEAFMAKGQGHAGLSRALENILSGIVEVKSFTAEDAEKARVVELSQNLAKVTVEAAQIPAQQSTLAANIYHAGYVPALTLAALRVLAGKMDKDQLSRSNFWYPKLVIGIGRLQASVATYYSAVASAERVVKVLEMQPTIKDGESPLDPSSVRGHIRFDSVTFGYRPSNPVLHELSIDLQPGTTLGLVGQSGSGKSTLLKLLLRFYDPDVGQILLDGKDLRQLHIRDLRSIISLVSQDVYLFNGTVRHNVLYGRASASDDEIEAALDAAGADDLLDSLPDGLATDVGEHGSRLSGGQRQRVAIARALLKDAPILALDEPTAHLDYATEAAVKSSLKTATQGRTVILVAHRLTSVRDCDRIIVLDKGVIQEQGRHEALLDHRGIYYRLWQLQS